jgi:hypothetical protein
MAFKTAGGFAGVLVAGVAIASIWMNPVVTLSGLRRPVESIGTESCIIESSELWYPIIPNVTYISLSSSTSLRECVSIAARQGSSDRPTELLLMQK